MLWYGLLQYKDYPGLPSRTYTSLRWTITGVHWHSPQYCSYKSGSGSLHCSSADKGTWHDTIPVQIKPFSSKKKKKGHPPPTQPFRHQVSQDETYKPRGSSNQSKPNNRGHGRGSKMWLLSDFPVLAGKLLRLSIRWQFFVKSHICLLEVD